MEQIKAVFVGAGNLSWSLIPALQSAGVKVDQLISRNEKKLRLFQQRFSIVHTSVSVKDLREGADLVFLTVNDPRLTR